jgi:diphthamide biosynthesis enzyme Dph1/Dph2-like protein
VFYVFGRKLLDVNDLLAKLSSELNPTDHILFMYDVIYQHTMEDLERILRLEKGFVNAIVAKVNPLFDKLRGGASESDGVAIDTNKSHSTDDMVERTCNERLRVNTNSVFCTLRRGVLRTLFP